MGDSTFITHRKQRHEFPEDSSLRGTLLMAWGKAVGQEVQTKVSLLPQ